MKNKILIGLTCLFVLICTVGCVNTKENTSAKNDNVKSDTEQTVKSKCSYYECLTKMSLDNTLEELNGIVGFEATKLESTSLDKYEYDFVNDKKITVSISNDKIVSIKIEYDKKELKNKKVTLDNLSDIKARINDGISYDEFKKAVGGVDGTLIEVSSWNKYVWVAEDGSSNVTASFGKDGNLKFFNGLGFKN